MLRIEYSTMCLDEIGYEEKINEAKELVESRGYEFGIQVHNSISPEFYQKLLVLKDNYSFTVHSPLLSGYFLNLAADDFKRVSDQCSRSLTHLDAFETDLFFFHGFITENEPVVLDMANYRARIRESVDKKYSMDESFIMNPSFFQFDDFGIYKKNFKKNLTKIKKMFREYTLAIENDFVGMGCGLQRPEEILELIDTLYLDLGHLWCSSLLYEFDFHTECERIIKKKNIIGVHINHNSMTCDTPKKQLMDTHGHLYEDSPMNLKPIIARLVEKGVQLFTLEIRGGDIEDVKILLDWLP